MTWIKTVPMAEADEHLRELVSKMRALYPREYDRGADEAGIVASHTLLPDALYHAFSTFGALMSPELPLSRRQHEMIATLVSVSNRCKY
jgi:hypothetical protein